MIADGLRSLDIPFLDGNIFRKVIMYCTRDIVINFVFFVNHRVTSTSHALLDCLDILLDSPGVLICGEFV